MSSFLEGEKGEEEATVVSAAANQSCWSRISPNHLDHRQRVPTAITLHRLVPRPPAPFHQAAAAPATTTTSTFKYITPEEIKAAQIRARQEILASRQAPPTPPPSDISAPPLSQNKKHHCRKDGSGSQASFPCHLGTGEVGLRRRQLTRLMSQISRILVDLQNLKDPHQRDFLAPLEVEIKKRRWNDCVRSMRRSLFVLRQEVVSLERGSGQGIANSRHLRALAAAARTLNTQLMTLKSQAESSCGDLVWTEVLEEFLGVARRMLILAARMGVQSPPSSVKWARLPQEGVTAAPADSSGLESAISISDVDSNNIHLLQSGHVRDRLARLATIHLKKRRKQRSPKSTVTRGRRQSEQDIVLEPLKKPLKGRRNTPLDTAAIHQCPASPSLFKGSDDSPTGVSSAPKNTSLDHHSQPSVPKTTFAGPQPHDPSFGTNSPVAPQPQSIQTQTNNIPVSQPQLLPCQSDFPAPETHTSVGPQASLLTPNLTQQLSFLLERVCKIEDSRRRTEVLIAEASQASHTHSVTPSLGDAVQQARLALAAVRGTAPHPQPPMPNTGITAYDSLPRSTGLSLKIPEGVLLRTSPRATMAHHSSEEMGEAASPLEGKWLAGESVTEQVRQQKEQFWLSLAKQGFVRPPETLPLSGKEIHFVVEHSNQPGSGKGSHKSSPEESVEEKFARTLKKTGVPMGHLPKKATTRTQSHQQTQTKSPAEQCQSSNESGSSSTPSHHSAVNSKTQHSPSSSQIKRDISSGNTKQSVTTESQLQQSVSVDSTSSSGMSSSTESQSFPSYEGISSLA